MIWAGAFRICAKWYSFFSLPQSKICSARSFMSMVGFSVVVMLCIWDAAIVWAILSMLRRVIGGPPCDRGAVLVSYGI